MLLLSAFAITFLTLLGEAGEDLGMDRLLKSNTARKRVQSLFRLGCMLYALMPGMPEHRLAPLVDRFADLIHQRRMFQNAVSVVVVRAGGGRTSVVGGTRARRVVEAPEFAEHSVEMASATPVCAIWNRGAAGAWTAPCRPI